MSLLRRGHARADGRLPVQEALGFWDVAHGRWTVDPGTYEIHAGASSADIRRTASLTVDGPPPAPRPALERGLAAADFDSADGVSLVDLTKVRGDAVAAGADVIGRLLFRACDFGAGARTVTVEAARAEHPSGGGAGAAGAATVELHLSDGTTLASVAIPPTGDPYRYTTVGADLPTPPSGVHDLHITLRGGLRLARLGFSG